jgi:hypothetical protein
MNTSPSITSIKALLLIPLAIASTTVVLAQSCVYQPGPPISGSVADCNVSYFNPGFAISAGAFIDGNGVRSLGAACANQVAKNYAYQWRMTVVKPGAYGSVVSGVDGPGCSKYLPGFIEVSPGGFAAVTDYNSLCFLPKKGVNQGYVRVQDAVINGNVVRWDIYGE